MNPVRSTSTVFIKPSNTSIYQKIQDAENNYDHLITAALQKNKLGSIATSEKNNEENTLKASTWNKAYNRREISRLPSVPSTPSFKVHVDPEAEIEPAKIVAKTPSNVLKARKAEFATNAMDVLGSGHSTRKTLQANLELYSGGREFSFEELRAAYYKKKSSKHEDFKTPMKNNQAFLSPSDSMYEWQTPTPVCAFSKLSLNSTFEGSGGKTYEKISDKDDSPVNKKITSDNISFQTPLQNLGFMPLTPSIKAVDLTEFSETPVLASESLTSRKKTLGFNNFSDGNSSEEKSHTIYPVTKSDVLPTIDENQEMENDSTSRQFKKTVVFPIRKKQLFTENSGVKGAAKPKSNFSIFVDED